MSVFGLLVLAKSCPRNNEAYDPEIVSIGPYQRDKVKLQMMEDRVHATWCSSFAAMVSSPPIDANQGRKWSFLKCTTKLRESGIKFVKATENFSLLDIKFANGIMKIPPLRIDNNTGCLLKNMAA
ncbi:unnamed protein product [Ilex paraguariensis]|uniref:Uncharacterized protein n=1 Tax=Ilex paraguariensis TaxID=185542 RepID=A0ABC8UJ54_9AQUA